MAQALCCPRLSVRNNKRPFKFKPAKHILLPSAVKWLAGNAELTQILQIGARHCVFSCSLESWIRPSVYRSYVWPNKLAFPCKVTSSSTRIQSLHLIISIVLRTPCQEEERLTASMGLPCSMQFMGDTQSRLLCPGWRSLSRGRWPLLTHLCRFTMLLREAARL